jgi:hypothetical protein
MIIAPKTNHARSLPLLSRGVACLVCAAGIAIMSAILCAPSFADYTVIDDDTNARMVAPKTVRSHYAIAFVRGSASLTVATRQHLSGLLPNMRGATLRIVGRPDAQMTAGTSRELLPRQRARMIQNFLLQQGILQENIAISVDHSPNPQPNGNTYPSDLFITHPAAPDTAMLSTVNASPQSGMSFTDKLIDLIIQGAQSGYLKPSVAMRLMQVLLEGARTTQPISTSPPIWQPAPAAAATAMPAQRQWSLIPALSLHANLDVWSASAGWLPVQWEASSAYEIKTKAVIEGAFPDVLRQIAESTDLNICADKRVKRVRVTDHSIPCI